jgi:hypothetical protein
MTTPNLALSELVAHQAQPHLTLNSALRRIDALVQASCLTQTNTPPGSPTDGDRHLVGTSPTGDWVDHANDIAAYIGTNWVYLTPAYGWITYLQSSSVLKMYSASGWITLGVTGLATDPLFSAKGDLIAGTGNDAAAILPVGTNGYVLAAASAETTGLEWVPGPEAGGDGAFYTCENLGAGSEVFAGTDTGGDPSIHSFRSLVAGTGIVLTQDGTTIEIASTAGAAIPTVGAKARKSSGDQSIAANTPEDITFDLEIVDDDGMWSGGATDRLTATAAGWHAINVNIMFNNSSTTGYRRTIIRHHSDVTIETDVASAVHPATTVIVGQNATALIHMESGDYITVECTASATLNVLAHESTYISMIRLPG